MTAPRGTLGAARSPEEPEEDLMPRVTLPSWLPIDPYILALVATVGLAALLPASGPAATGVGAASSLAIGLLFFLYGARLSTREAVQGLAHWRLHLTVLLST